MIQPVLLISDALLFFLLAVAGLSLYRAWQHRPQREAWQQVLSRPAAMSACVLLSFFLICAVLDSLHFRRALPQEADQPLRYAVEVESVLDTLFRHDDKSMRDRREKSYSAPFALTLFERQTVERDGQQRREYPRLKNAATHVSEPEQHGAELAQGLLISLTKAAFLSLLAVLLVAHEIAHRQRCKLGAALQHLQRGNTLLAWRSALITLIVLLYLFGPLYWLNQHWHVFGTDRTGNDVFYYACKAIRTALLIGSLTTLITLPLGVGLGLLAGYLGGWVDDVIQYLYTVISSIPWVLLIAASVLLIQVFIEAHSTWFDTAAARADARLVALCAIIGAISWTSLCRLIRAETLKLKNLDYVQAARALGVKPLVIMRRHILPNAAHIILITLALDFSSLVLAEAVLSYVGVGVDPGTISYGTMINSARAELARDPTVWWQLASAFVFMLSLVLAANVFADAVREAFDPRGRKTAALPSAKT